MMKKHAFFAIFVALLVSACDYQRRVTAAEIGCHKEKIVFPDGEPWITPNYWVARCGEREFVCSNSSAVFVSGRNVPIAVGSGKSGVTCSQIVD
ncbi:MAG: hypothetical protein K2N12_02830 [Helicobacter sp.]|nr:hypothetical protein [Helicobacter sp.]